MIHLPRGTTNLVNIHPGNTRFSVLVRTVSGRVSGLNSILYIKGRTTRNLPGDVRLQDLGIVLYQGHCVANKLGHLLNGLGNTEERGAVTIALRLDGLNRHARSEVETLGLKLSALLGNGGNDILLGELEG